MNPGKVVEPYRWTRTCAWAPTTTPGSPPTHFKFPARPRQPRACHAALRRRREVPPLRRRRHVPQLHGDARGKALHPRPRPPAMGDDAGRCDQGWLAERRSEGVAGPLPLLQRLQERLPGPVDMATYKAEFLSHYYEGRLRPLNALRFRQHRFLGAPGVECPGPGQPDDPDCRSCATSRSWSAGIPAAAQHSGLCARRHFKSWFARHRPRIRDGPLVVLWPDTFNNYFLPGTAKAAVDVLENAGFRLNCRGEICAAGARSTISACWTAPRACCCRSWTRCAPEIEAGIPVVGLEPSCVAVFRDELCNLFPNDERAQRLSRQTFLLSEFLESYSERFRCPAPAQGPRPWPLPSQVGVEDERRGSRSEAAWASIADSRRPGCCGWRVVWFRERQIRRLDGDRRTGTAARRSQGPADWLVIADGFSCREQIAPGNRPPCPPLGGSSADGTARGARPGPRGPTRKS